MGHHLAYIDVGTGSMLIQVAIAAIVAIPLILRTQIGRGATFVRGLFGRKETESTDDAGGR